MPNRRLAKFLSIAKELVRAALIPGSFDAGWDAVRNLGQLRCPQTLGFKNPPEPIFQNI